MSSRKLLPDATTLDVACQNLRAMVRLCPDYESPTHIARREWERFSTRHTPHYHKETKSHED